MKNTFQGKGKKEKRWNTVERWSKTRWGDIYIDNIIDKNETEKTAKYNGAGGKDEESDLEKINIEKHVIISIVN